MLTTYTVYPSVQHFVCMSVYLLKASLLTPTPHPPPPLPLPSSVLMLLLCSIPKWFNHPQIRPSDSVPTRYLPADVLLPVVVTHVDVTNT